MSKETFESVSARQVGPRHAVRLRPRWTAQERVVVAGVGLFGLVAFAALIAGLTVIA